MVDMPWTEIEKKINNGAIALVPVGVIEEHGPHMSCGSDIYQAYLSAKIVKMDLDKKNIPVLIALPVYWGITNIASCFPGTFTVSDTTGQGEPKNIEVLRRVISESIKKFDMHSYFLIEEKKQDDYRNSEFAKCILPVKYKSENNISSRCENVHAGTIETGSMAGFFPELVDTLLTRTLESTDFRERKEFKSPADVVTAWNEDARNVTPLGYFGDPASFDLK